MSIKDMEKINRLLDLYFAGETTITQEQELKQYFASQNVAAEHKIYQQLFETFEVEKSEKYHGNLPKIKTQSTGKKPFITLIISTTIAASILLMTGIFQTSYDDSYVIINGKRINDSELALQIAQAKIKKISASLESGMKHVKSINKINENLKPLQKIGNIKNKIQHTLDKINIKL
ncbi:MAG: hypothetical protein LBC68_06045 [Prevotellaceae bacterium]|jgi:hypothetical protein|nr:hypothetical protein [Prevotellaceae bacterium]